MSFWKFEKVRTRFFNPSKNLELYFTNTPQYFLSEHALEIYIFPVQNGLQRNQWRNVWVGLGSLQKILRGYDKSRATQAWFDSSKWLCALTFFWTSIGANKRDKSRCFLHNASDASLAVPGWIYRRASNDRMSHQSIKAFLERQRKAYVSSQSGTSLRFKKIWGKKLPSYTDKLWTDQQVQ